MANIVSAQKRAKQAIVRNARNSAQKSRIRTLIKKVITAIAAGDKSAAQDNYGQLVPALDRSVNKNLFTKNKAARHKSRLNAHIKQLA